MSSDRAWILIATAIQACLVAFIVGFIDAAPRPPARVTLIIGGQLLLVLLVGKKRGVGTDRLVQCAFVAMVLYVCTVGLLFGNGAGVAVARERPASHAVNPLVRMESVVSIVLLLGFMLMNTLMLARLIKEDKQASRAKGARTEGVDGRVDDFVDTRQE